MSKKVGVGRTELRASNSQQHGRIPEILPELPLPGFLISFFPRVSVQTETKQTGSSAQGSPVSPEKNAFHYH